jgi:hypothetical protein
VRTSRLLVACLLVIAVDAVRAADEPPSPPPPADDTGECQAVTAVAATAVAEAAAPATDDTGATAEPVPSAEELERAGARIGDIWIANGNVFDPTAPGENRWLFRLANRLHMRTRVPVVCRQLLFAPGDQLRAQALAESERLLRSDRYLHDAQVRPLRVRQDDDGVERVDVEVTTKDVWTLALGVGVGRSGGTTDTHLLLRDSNFLGTGRYLSLARDTNVDRTETQLTYIDPNLLGRRGRLQLDWSDNSDGLDRQLILARPFYALDSRWGAGLTVQQVEREDSRYSLGHSFDAFAHDRKAFELWGGHSRGLRPNGRALRTTWGFSWVEDSFAAIPRTTVPVPADQTWAYPWVGLELVEDEFHEERNLDQMGRTEDIFLGLRATARLGLASTAVGADHDAAVLSANVDGGRRLAAGTTLLYSAYANGRLASGGTENLLYGASARLLHRDFGSHLLVASLAADFARDLDGGAQLLLGGDSGLRGYPLRYQAGSARVLASIEQRFFTNWYPWRLVHIGGAVFADVGRTFGDPAVPGTDQGLLRDVGLGLRLAPSRSGLGAVIHIDLAFPLDGDPSIKNVQWLVRTRASF